MQFGRGNSSFIPVIPGFGRVKAGYMYKNWSYPFMSKVPSQVGLTITSSSHSVAGSNPGPWA